MGQVTGLIQAFQEGQDIHTRTASDVFHVPLEAVDKELRRRAKAINFGIIYGISAFGLAKQLKISRTEADSYIKTYFQRYPQIREFMDAQKKQAKEHGHVVTLLGRRCYIRGLDDRNGAVRSFAERQAMNAPLQGTAADIIKRAMIRIDQALAAQGLDARMILQVHDELVFEVRSGEVDRLRTLVKPLMEGVLKLDVPLLVDESVDQAWS
jgi:DNA polymerase-1